MAERERRMATTNEQVIETLNRLLAVCTHSERGFRIAADGATDGELRTIFKQFAHQRGRLAFELRMEIRLLGGEAKMLEGEIPEWLRAVGAAVSRQDERGVVAECHGMNQAVVAAFESALQDGNIPVELLITARRQRDQVNEAVERLAAWERGTAAGAGGLVPALVATLGARRTPQVPDVIYEAG
jgi:uncharacterized protein (TIGR02284 family)